MFVNQLSESNNLSFESTRFEHGPGKIPNSKSFEEAKNASDCENVDEMMVSFARCPVIAYEEVPVLAAIW